MFRDLIVGLSYLHGLNIIHRDIKPDNLLVTYLGRVKIADFGVSHQFPDAFDDILTSSAGSPAFIAPELCIAGGRASGRAVDIWAAGITLYYMVFGNVPFMADNLLDLHECILNDPVVFPHSIEPDLQDLIEKMLDKNPDTRIRLGDIMQHTWVTCNNLMPLECTNIATIAAAPPSSTQRLPENATSQTIKTRQKRFSSKRFPSGVHLNDLEKDNSVIDDSSFTDTDTEDDYGSTGVTDTDVTIPTTSPSSSLKRLPSLQLIRPSSSSSSSSNANASSSSSSSSSSSFSHGALSPEQPENDDNVVNSNEDADLAPFTPVFTETSCHSPKKTLLDGTRAPPLKAPKRRKERLSSSSKKKRTKHSRRASGTVLVTLTPCPSREMSLPLVPQ
eukprot:TRINITY_DN846_c0_g2_i2.p2 TRINITY_DN846_c0_g2~~TRINITY_DN846_c0_g2_i2.p2  ORF type:complete len:389 (+),score=188.83 TRINITY_DN846_c0_g2_i2:949-2115(+)